MDDRLAQARLWLQKWRWYERQPGGMTERALRDILLLPKELWPSELISLFDMGGPSFAMADHADHIHVGF